jgi:type II secretory ATPase GspE/PulE/Tfp pilus assembly ATPase PilB-like protein
MSKKIIANIFNYAAQEGAKDMIIEKLPQKISINYLFPNGETRTFGLPEKLEEELRTTLRQVLSLAPDDLTVKKYCKLKNRSGCLNFYLTILPSSNGEKMIVNLTPKENKLLRLKQLGLQSKQVKNLQAAIKHRSGLILIGSPVCQGKGTTLYSLLQELDVIGRSSYFLGDGLEYHLDNINCLTNTQNNWNIVLNLDSDVIITEITKEEDLKNTFMAATTGRLVLATINANSVWEIMLAVLKLKLPLKLKLDSLRLITNQRIIPLKRSRLKMAYRKKNERQNIGLFELLTLTPEIKKFLLEEEGNKAKENFWENLSRLALKNGYEPLSYDKQKKIKNGLI